ncbi:MAG TPA: DUF6308 family protein [Streptosporangiaceae bacterium]|nr:DUF6308 family protein [Streptosporangiaceae bacterium]
MNDSVPVAVRRLRDGLEVPGLASALAVYFSPGSGLAGRTFSFLGANPRDAITADDLLAVSLLDITWRPGAVRDLLENRAELLSELLAGISSDLDLWEAADADLAAIDPMWQALTAVEGVGTATAAKLLARKRPRLCPVTDKVVIQAAGVPGRTWTVLRALLSDPDARTGIERLRPPAAPDITLLRVLDVAIWARYSPSRTAARLRRVSGMPEPPEGSSAASVTMMRQAVGHTASLGPQRDRYHRREPQGAPRRP